MMVDDSWVVVRFAGTDGYRVLDLDILSLGALRRERPTVVRFLGVYNSEEYQLRLVGDTTFVCLSVALICVRERDVVKGKVRCNRAHAAGTKQSAS